MSPADADTTIVKARIVAAHISRKVLILFAPNMRYKNFVAYKNLVSTLEQP
jgi:hypothetical protein